MKKKILLLIVLMIFITNFALVSSTSPDTSIDVIKPEATTVWKKGLANRLIQWTKTGSMDRHVRILLLKSDGTTLVKTISASTANDGELFWTVPGHVPDGNYAVRVQTLDGLYSDTSAVFKIEPRFPVAQFSYRADLYVSRLEISPSAPQANDLITVKATVSNRGNYKAIPTVALLTINLSRGYRMKYYEINIPELSPPGGRRPHFPFTINYRMRKGRFYNELVVDFGDKIKESDETNNKKSIHYTIAPALKPDLRVCIIRRKHIKLGGSTATQGKPIFVRVENIGDAPSPECKLKFWIETKGEELLTVPVLQPGEEYYLKRINTWRNKGQRKYTVEVDPSNAVDEKNENNNRMVGWIIKNFETYFPDQVYICSRGR